MTNPFVVSLVPYRFPTVVALNIYNWLNEPHLSDTFKLSYRSYNPINPIYVKGHNSSYIPTFFVGTSFIDDVPLKHGDGPLRYVQSPEANGSPCHPNRCSQVLCHRSSGRPLRGGGTGATQGQGAATHRGTWNNGRNMKK